MYIDNKCQDHKNNKVNNTHAILYLSCNKWNIPQIDYIILPAYITYNSVSCTKQNQTLQNPPYFKTLNVHQKHI